MKYIKITEENASRLLVAGAILAYSKEFLQGSELDKITEDRILDIDGRVDNGKVLTIGPNGSNDMTYEISDLTDGHWWLKDFSKIKAPNNPVIKSVTLTSSAILLVVGVYMVARKMRVSGYTGPGRSGGMKPDSISGPFVILLGLFLLGGYIMMRYSDKRE